MSNRREMLDRAAEGTLRPERPMARDRAGRFVGALSSAQKDRLRGMLPNAPSMRWARSPQYQALARSLDRRFPELAAMRGPGQSAVAGWYGVLRDLANPAQQATWLTAFGLPENAPRSQLLNIISQHIPELGNTAEAFEKTLSTVATAEGIERLGLKRFGRDVEQERLSGRPADSLQKMQTQKDRNEIGNAWHRRATIERAARESAAATPAHKRGRFDGAEVAKPNSSRRAELEAQYAAHTGKQAMFDPSSAGFKAWQKEHGAEGLGDVDELAARQESVRSHVAGVEKSSMDYESSLQSTPEEAEGLAERWEQETNYGTR